MAQAAAPARAGSADGYARHRPEHTLLYRIVAQHYQAFVELLAGQGQPLPDYHGPKGGCQPARRGPSAASGDTLHGSRRRKGRARPAHEPSGTKRRALYPAYTLRHHLESRQPRGCGLKAIRPTTCARPGTLGSALASWPMARGRKAEA